MLVAGLLSKEVSIMRVYAKRIALFLVVLVAFSSGILVGPTIDAAIQKPKSKKMQIKPQKREKPTIRRSGKNYKVKKGAEVAAKVKKFKESNKSVRAALKVFEDKKRMPKIDQSFAINGALSSLKTGLNTVEECFRTSVTNNCRQLVTPIDIIFVPVLSLDLDGRASSCRPV
jgi:exosome complex RNA-binding protein Csl4